MPVEPTPSSNATVDQLTLMGRQIEELLIHQHAFLGVHFGGNRYRENEEKMAAEMIAESTSTLRKIEIARDILNMVDQYNKIILKPLFDDQDKIYELLARFAEVYRQTPFAVANSDESILKIEKLYGEWLSLTEELHKARLKAITAARNLVELDALNPNHIIKHNGDISVGVPIEEFANLGVAAEVLLKEGCSKEHELTEKRTALSLEAFGDPNAYIKVKEEIRMDDKANSGNDLMTRLESFAKERMGVPYREFERVLRECDTSITVACLNQVLKLACDQWGFWEAEWLFSPAHSPNTLAKTEMEGWKALWRGSLDTLVETVPNVKDLLEQEQNLVVFGHSLRRAIEYNKTKPFRKIAAPMLSKLSIVLNKIGLHSIANDLYSWGLYPKGTVARP